MGCCSSRSADSPASRVTRWRSTGIVALRDARLKVVPNEVLQVGNSLRILDLTNNKIAEIPQEVGTLVNMQRLVLAGNLVESIPANIGYLRNLKILTLDRNKISVLPEELGSLSNLQQLSISQNSLSRLPKSVGDLRNMLLLNVSDNKLIALPESIGGCSSLEELQANGNSIEDVPSSICNLVCLKSLSLNGNRICQLPQNLLKDCKALQNISLHDNPISMDQFQQMDGFTEFEARRRKKFDKQIDSNVMMTLAHSACCPDLLQILAQRMEDQMANLRLTDFEFFRIILPGSSKTKLKLPYKFARELGDRELREARLRVAGEGRRPWDVKVFDDDVSGDVYLGRGWQEFARAHDLRDGHFLIFRYDGAAAFTVTVFDETIGSSSSSDSSDAAAAAAATAAAEGVGDVALSQFAVTLRQCNLEDKQAQYLNVPMEFQEAHEYARREKVVLRMRGEAWTVRLKHSRRERGQRTAFRYGWHRFCVDNGLAVGDTCFFRVLREGDLRRGGAADDHVLKVAVRKADGTTLE
uniref:TF-B3 domain-containing protein n=1 Tax=Oryza nivara TaxID=4536 RepID=A0A0E0GIW5_ORYNI